MRVESNNESRDSERPNTTGLGVSLEQLFRTRERYVGGSVLVVFQQCAL